jgi:hypothetical protein
MNECVRVDQRRLKFKYRDYTGEKLTMFTGQGKPAFSDMRSLAGWGRLTNRTSTNRCAVISRVSWDKELTNQKEKQRSTTKEQNVLRAGEIAP